MILIDTASIHHSLRAVGKVLDYKSFITYLQDKYQDTDITIFADKNATGFVDYLNTLGVEVVTKEPLKKKISDGKRIWYLSFAVDMALCFVEYERCSQLVYPRILPITIVSTDIEILPICAYRMEVYGIGIPRMIRDTVKTYDIPSIYMKDKQIGNSP